MNLFRFPSNRSPRGFTLLELLVAITVLSIVSIIAWRGLDSLVRTRERLEPERDEIRALLTTFGQLERDLNHIATPALFALSTSPVSVRNSTQGPVIQITRIAPSTNTSATAIQMVFWRVQDGVLLRQATTPSREFYSKAAEDAEQMTNARLLPRIKSMRVRLWRETGWIDPLLGEPPPIAGDVRTPGFTVSVPQGLELILEREDGKTFRRVMLVG